jgi:uncharacterized alpha-E superfamily protein
MLSRVADSLYWMSRYVERSENIARILDVNLQLLLDLQKLDDKELGEFWEPVLESTGDEDEYAELYKETKTADVLDFLTFNPKNRSSILSCITSARENARQVRDQISDEMWEELNATYLKLKGLTVKKIGKSGVSDFFQTVKASSHLFQGITDSTMVHGEGWDFLQMGKWIERAEKTTRIIDAKYDSFLSRPENAKTALDGFHWNAVLKSCSGLEAYRKLYRAQVEPQTVLNFLIFHENFPRSLRYGAAQLDDCLRRISGCRDEHFSNEAEKLSGRLLAELNYSGVGDILSRGLHEYLDEVQTKLNQIGDSAYQRYMFYSPQDLQYEIQQQQQ